MPDLLELAEAKDFPRMTEWLMIHEPQSATSRLREAAEHAAHKLWRQLPKLRAGRLTDAMRAGLAKMVEKEALIYRNDWLKQHGVYADG